VLKALYKSMPPPETSRDSLSPLAFAETTQIMPRLAPSDAEEDQPQVVARVLRPTVSRAGDREVLPSPDLETGPARVVLPRDSDRGASVAARTTRVAAGPRTDRSEEVIITGEGTGSEQGSDSGLSVSLQAPRSHDVRVPELTDDDDSSEPVQAPAVVALPVVTDAQIKPLMEDARVAKERGDLARAIQCLTDVLDMRPELADAYINRGHCHLDLGDYSSAMSDFQRAEDLEPNKPEPHFAMGNLYFNRKEYKRAIEFYDQAMELDGSHAMARCRRGISHYYRKSYRQAYQDLQAAYRLDPEIPNIRKYVQMAMKKMEKPD
jgi:hypothetical protein